MRYSFALAAMMAAAISVPVVAAPAGDARLVSLPAQPLAASLQAIAQRFGIDLLFSQAMAVGRLAPTVSGRLQAQQALDLLLTGSGLIVHKTADGSYIIAKASVAQGGEPEATPDILVIGRRTSNTDIRRTENDVRPYQVVSRQQIAEAHIATIEELAAKRLPANAQGATLSQQGASAAGETASSINLRGLGTDQTLILIDGRRLPQMPGETGGFLQSDVNAVPPEAIERVEAITATAGGIYGPGANAGVINLVLRRDYRGVDLAVTNGVTERGDAPYRRVDLRLGFTPDHGSTDVMLDVSQSNFGGLDVGDRDFLFRANTRSFANDPKLFIRYDSSPFSSLNVMSTDGSALVFKPSYGGATLNTSITYAPRADGRSAAALAQTLTANAGRFDLTPSANAAGAAQTLLSGRRTSSIIASARHRAGAIELFIDYLRLTNIGHARLSYDSGRVTLNAADPGNPFAQDITIIAPDPDIQADYSFNTLVTRTTGGVIVDLPGRWRGEADYSAGNAGRSSRIESRDFTLAGATSYYSQLYGAVDLRNPLGNYSEYLSSFEGLFGPEKQSFQQSNRYRDATLRLAGPVLRLGGGDLTATFLAEKRNEHVSGGTSDGSSPLVDDIPTQSLPNYAQATSSIYGEARAPLVDAQSGFTPLRGLEVQLAVRRDKATTQASLDGFSRDGGGTRTIRNSGTVFTGGFKVSPFSGILLRGSISTGEQPLTVSDLSRNILAGVGLTDLPDPRRGNIPHYYTFDEIFGGPLHPRPEFARSLSAGIIIQPKRLPDLRLSIDYTHITKRGENVVSLANDIDYFIANEESYPDRVIRAPLTPEDAALGYTGGLITAVDTSSLQNGSTIIDAVDTQLDYRFSTRRIGTLDLHAAATWQPHFRRIIGFGLPSRNFSGSSDGAPAIRGNAGVRWTLGSISLSMDGQLTGQYRLASAIEFLQNSEDAVFEGSDKIPAQATLDIGAEYRLSLPGTGLAGRPRTLELRFGIQDVLDSRPAIDVTAPGDYNSYVDPRRRRFELTVVAGF